MFDFSIISVQFLPFLTSNSCFRVLVLRNSPLYNKAPFLPRTFRVVRHRTSVKDVNYLGNCCYFYEERRRAYQVLICSPHLISTSSFFDRPLATVHRAH